jgi:adenine nucleotide transporter 17
MIKKMIREEGIGAFFKGVLPAIVMTINPVIQYIIYETLRKQFLSSDGSISAGNIIWISLLSKLVTTFMTYPMLTVKTLFQSNDKKTSREIIYLINELLENSGFIGLYKGISAKLTQTLINNCITMLVYEKLQIIIKHLVLTYLLKKDK